MVFQSTLLFIAAQETTQDFSVAPPEDELTCADLRIAVVRVKSAQERNFVSTPAEILEKVGDWITDGPATCFGLHIDGTGKCRGSKSRDRFIDIVY